MLTFLSVCFIALVSLIGALVFRGTESLETKYPYAVPVAIGMFLGVIFFELIPETLASAGTAGSVAIVVGFLGFYILAHGLRTYHHHHPHENDHDECGESKASASLLLVGDSIHNFADGIVLASAFIVSPAVGLATTFAIALHEIPQEIAEFGILLRAGYSRRRALVLNFISATAAIFGAMITTYLAREFGAYLWILTGIAAGNLLYISASDLLPEMHGEHEPARSFLLSFTALVLGMVLIVCVMLFAHEFFG